MVRKNKDGSISVGILTDEVTKADVKTEAKSEEITSADVKKTEKKAPAKKTASK